MISENREFLLLGRKIDEMIVKHKEVVVAIDGPCGAGKSTLTDMLVKHYKANDFHLDDYFLTPELRTEERLKEPGGNVDYERFYQEIILGISQKKSFSYFKYKCKSDEMERIEVEGPRPLTVIEGSYSLHPYLRAAYDLKIFLTVEPEVQIKRILKRNGAELGARFFEEWIPLENLYFEALSIKAEADMILDGSLLDINL